MQVHDKDINIYDAIRPALGEITASQAELFKWVVEGSYGISELASTVSKHGPGEIIDDLKTSMYGLAQLETKLKSYTELIENIQSNIQQHVCIRTL